MESITSASSMLDEEEEKMHMHYVLIRKPMFDAFMRLLFKEHSYECLLAITEMVQYKKRVINELMSSKQRTMIEHSVHRRLTEHFLDIPRECPKSLIVYGGSPRRRDFKAISIELFDKYV